MGQAKKRGSQEERAAQAVADNLGQNPFEVAYEAIFGMVKEVYGQTGGVNHQLLGLDFKSGKIAGVNCLQVDNDNINRLPDNIQNMLDRWPVVVHVMEAWEAPPGSIPAHEHPEKKDIIAITIHADGIASAASCEVNAATREVKKGPLLAVQKMEGRFARPLAVKH